MPNVRWGQTPQLPGGHLKNFVRGSDPINFPALQAGQAIYLKLSFPGDSPHHGISYVDAAGTTHYLSMMQSGFDGSLALSEEKAFT